MTASSVRVQGSRKGPSSRAAAGQLRLTRRGRAVVVLFLLLVLLAVAIMAGARSAATGDAGTPAPTRTVVVDRGDTLWEIAGAVAGAGEVREMVHRIEKLNALAGPELVEGQVLAVPLR